MSRIEGFLETYLIVFIGIWRRGRDYSSLRSSPLRGRRRNAPALSRTAARRSARTEGFSSDLHTPDKAKGPTRGPFALLAEREGFEPSVFPYISIC